MGSRKTFVDFFLLWTLAFSSSISTSQNLKQSSGFFVCSELFQSSVPSSKVPLLALGIGDPKRGMSLDEFSFSLADAIGERVITWKNLKDYNLSSTAGKDFTWVKKAIPEAIEKLIALKPGKKVIVFNLDSIDLSRLGENTITNFELETIKNNPKYFEATSFFLNKKQLSDQEARSYLGMSKD